MVEQLTLTEYINEYLALTAEVIETLTAEEALTYMVVVKNVINDALREANEETHKTIEIYNAAYNTSKKQYSN